MNRTDEEVGWEILLHEAHEIAEQMRERLRYLQRRYQFPKKVLDELEKAGIDLADKRQPLPH